MPIQPNLQSAKQSSKAGINDNFLVRYSREQLEQHDKVLARIREIADIEMRKYEAKQQADSMRTTFTLRGSDRPADEPLQPHLF